MITHKIKIDMDGQREIYSELELSTGDYNAYGLVLEFYTGGKFYDITGYNLAVYARRSGSDVPIPDVGRVEGGKGYYVIKPSMYAYAGRTQLLTGAGMHAVTKVLYFTVRSGFSSSGGAVVDEADYSVLGQLIQEAQAATAEAVVGSRLSDM